MWAYTAQFGGGFSGTISTEARRTTQIIDANGLPGPAGTQALAGAGTIIPGGFPCAATVTGNTGVAGTAVGGCGALFPGTGAYGGMQTGDIVANLRVDQAWGGAQVMGALHEVNASYYSAANALQSAPSTTGAGGVGHPGDKWGWAAGVGSEDQYALHHPRRLVPGAGERHAGRAPLSVQHPEHQLGQG